jgi:HlyD family secretion protein
MALSQKELSRQEELSRSGATTSQDLDRARALHDQNRQRVAQLEADLKTARLGARSDQIAAAEANVQALEAALAAAEWSLSQKSRTAPQAGLVFDTMYRQGEWVPAGRPVVALLPPQNVKVRAFVPETRVHALHPGDPVQVIVDGAPGPLAGRISFISPHAEYTPPVIYSRENRSKLVFMIEVAFDPNTAAILHPGQPVDVRLGL